MRRTRVFALAMGGALLVAGCHKTDSDNVAANSDAPPSEVGTISNDAAADSEMNSLVDNATDDNSLDPQAGSGGNAAGGD